MNSELQEKFEVRVVAYKVNRLEKLCLLYEQPNLILTNSNNTNCNSTLEKVLRSFFKDL